MDILILVLFTAIAFLCIFLGRIYHSQGIGVGFSAVGMLIFLLIALVFVREEAITTIAGSTPASVNIPLGLTNDHISIIYLSFSLMSFYAEL